MDETWPITPSCEQMVEVIILGTYDEAVLRCEIA